MCYFTSGSHGKVVVLPIDYSVWMNIKTILDELVQRGLEVTVLTSSAAIFIDHSKSSTIKFEVYPTCLSKSSFEDLFKNWINEWTYNFAKYTLWTYYSQMQKIFRDYSDTMEMLC
jgi:glucuronosyltransferase